MSMAERYCDMIHDNFQDPYYATWLPSVSMKLGDYGVVEDDIFTKHGNIRDFGVNFTAQLGNTAEDFEFTSQGTKIMNITAGTEGFVNAGLKWNFTKKFDLYFLAADVQISLMDDQQTVINTLKPIFKSKGMNGDFVVTQVLNAASTTVLIALDSNAEFSVEAKTAAIPNIDLKNPSGSFSLKTANKMGFKTVGKEGLTPLIGLEKVKS